MRTAHFYPNDVRTTHGMDNNVTLKAHTALLPWEGTVAEALRKYAPTKYK